MNEVTEKLNWFGSFSIVKLLVNDRCAENHRWDQSGHWKDQTTGLWEFLQRCWVQQNQVNSIITFMNLTEIRTANVLKSLTKWNKSHYSIPFLHPPGKKAFFHLMANEWSSKIRKLYIHKNGWSLEKIILHFSECKFQWCEK